MSILNKRDTYAKSFRLVNIKTKMSSYKMKTLAKSAVWAGKSKANDKVKKMSSLFLQIFDVDCKY